MLGKQKCRILKEIRQRIADENDIPYVTEECSHKGNCLGTCPRCESEVRYLENQLQKRASLGKRVTVAGLCVGMAFTAAGCDVVDNVKSLFEPTAVPEVFVTEGEVPYYPDPEPTETPVPSGSGDVIEIPEDLSGYVP